MRMLPVFLARVKPASHMAKPACIKKTSAAPSRTQMVLTDEYIVFLLNHHGRRPRVSRALEQIGKGVCEMVSQAPLPLMENTLPR